MTFEQFWKQHGSYQANQKTIAQEAFDVGFRSGVKAEAEVHSMEYSDLTTHIKDLLQDTPEWRELLARQKSKHDPKCAYLFDGYCNCGVLPFDKR